MAPCSACGAAILVGGAHWSSDRPAVYLSSRGVAKLSRNGSGRRSAHDSFRHPVSGEHKRKGPC